MPGQHAKLSPSSAKQWMACTPSIKLGSQFPNTSSSYAEEGTLAHSIAEKKLTKWITKSRKKIVCEDKEMDDYTTQYLDYIVEVFNKVKKNCKDPFILVEQKLDLSEWTIDGFGTGDCIIIGDDTLHIIDLKYGEGDPVSSYDNPQLRLYALGAIKEFGILYEFDKVDMHIMQPRIDNTSDMTMTVKELVAWGNDEVKPKAVLAYDGLGDYNPGKSQCKWCKAKAVCKARADNNLQLKEYGYLDPDLLNNEEISEILKKLEDLTSWAGDIKAHALDTMLQGVKYPGWKLVEGRSTRKVIDEDGLVKNLVAEGYDKSLLYTKKLANLTALEKLAGKKDFAIISAGCIEKPAGAPTIAPESDKRAEYNSGAKDFAQELGV